MSWHYSRALVEEYSQATCLDGELSALSNTNHMPLLYSSSDRMMEFCARSRSGMTCGPLTGTLGEAVLTWFLEGFPARTFPQRDEAKESRANAPASGKKWRESFAKWDRDSSSWKIPHALPIKGLGLSLETWPAWGSMRNGECTALLTQNSHRFEKDCGLLPAPCATDWKERGCVKRQAKNWEDKNYAHQKRPAMFFASFYNDSMPVGFTEMLMGWPAGWSDSRPLETDKFRQWLSEHGKN